MFDLGSTIFSFAGATAVAATAAGVINAFLSQRRSASSSKPTKEAIQEADDAFRISEREYTIASDGRIAAGGNVTLTNRYSEVQKPKGLNATNKEGV